MKWYRTTRELWVLRNDYKVVAKMRVKRDNKYWFNMGNIFLSY